MQEIRQIPVEKIKVGEYALRMEAEDETLDDLAASIRRVGILVPLIVRSEGDKYDLIAGHRRLVAAMRLGLAEVPCIIRDSSEAQSSEMAFAENIFRQDLSAVEIAAGIKDILDQKIMEVPELARVVRLSEHWVRAQVAMLGWPADVLEAIHQRWLSVAAASNLAMIQDDSYRNFLLSNARDSGATARTTAAWLQAWCAQQPAEEAVQAEPVPGSQVSQPALPQAPCIACGNVQRTDGLAMVMICTGCLNTIRGV